MYKIILLLFLFTNSFAQINSDFYPIYNWGTNKEFIEKTFIYGELAYKKEDMLVYSNVKYNGINSVTLFGFDKNKKLILIFISLLETNKSAKDNIHDFMKIQFKLLKRYYLYYTNFYDEVLKNHNYIYSGYLYAYYYNSKTYVIHILKYKDFNFEHSIIFTSKNKSVYKIK